MAPATKMQGFGSDDLGLTKSGRTQTQHADIHNKPPPRSFWHAASRLASTTWDVVKPGDDKAGYTGADARKAAADAFFVMNGNCKYTGRLQGLEDRMRCPCAGCQSWDNEGELAKRRENEEFEKAAKAKQLTKAEEDAKKKAEDGARNKTPGYAPPSMSLPASMPQPQQKGPWGPAQNESKEECSAEQQPPATATKADPAPVADLLGSEEIGSSFAFVNAAPTSVAVTSTDLLGEEVAADLLCDATPTVAAANSIDLLGEAAAALKADDLLLMSNASADHKSEADLIGLAPAPEPKPSEQLAGLF